MPDFYTIRDVLGFALRLEQASQEFYKRLSRTVDSSAVCAYLLTLVEEEKLHEVQIQELLDRQDEICTDPIPAYDVQAYVEAVKVPASMSYKEAVKLALNKEKSAEMLYSVIAGVMEDTTLKEIFLLLCDQERIHKEFFEKEYARIRIGEN